MTVSALVVTKRLTAGPRNLGRPRELDIHAGNWNILGGGGMRVPDGRHIAFMAGKRTFEVWALEGILSGKNTSR